MTNITKSLFERLNWRPNVLTFLQMLILLAVYPAVKYANPQWFFEDGIVENIQLAICLCCFMAAWFAPRDKALFRFFALVIILIIFREISTGRHWLCAYYNLPQESKWKDIPYGLVLYWGRNLFAIFTFVYFLWHKVYKSLWQYIKKAPIFVWEFLFLAAGVILALLAEKPIDNEIMEEMAETLFYLALFNLIWRYEYSKLSLN